MSSENTSYTRIFTRQKWKYNFFFKYTFNFQHSPVLHYIVYNAFVFDIILSFIPFLLSL